MTTKLGIRVPLWETWCLIHFFLFVQWWLALVNCCCCSHPKQFLLFLPTTNSRFSPLSVRYFVINMLKCSSWLCLLSLSNIGVWLVGIAKSLAMRYHHLTSRESKVQLPHPCCELSAVHIKGARTGTQTGGKRFQVKSFNSVDNKNESVVQSLRIVIWDDDALYQHCIRIRFMLNSMGNTFRNSIT